MKQKYTKKIIKICAVAATVVMTAQVAQAGLITSTFDSSWTQFQSTPGEDGQVGPGGGGQEFDAEYLLYKIYYASNMLYLGLQAGFDIINGDQTYNGGRKIYYAGDLALSFNGVNYNDNTGSTWEYAVDFGNLTKGYYGSIPGGNTGVEGIDKAGLYRVSKWSNDVDIYYKNSNPFAMDEGTDVGGTFETEAAKAGDSYWRTIGFSLAELGITATDGFSFDAHWTMSCGNDEINGQMDIAPVPEPATMLLLGTGLVGLAVAGRRRKMKDVSTR